MVPEIPNPMLPDVAMAGWFKGKPPGSSKRYDGPVIYYNPAMIAQVGPGFATFTQVHEYGHIELGHIRRRSFIRDLVATHWITPQLELDADEFATRTLLSKGDVNPVRAAANQLNQLGPYQYSPSHPPGALRAQHIVQVAADFGVQL